MSFQDFEPLLAKVQKPGRYTGGEPGSIMKNPQEVLLRYAFCFPDTYEIGMSNLAMKILYSLANARADCWCERVFAPWVDMEAAMREAKVPLWALESGDFLREFDVLGFTLQYEMSYTNVLNMLDLAGIPLRSAERKELAPLVIAGGPCACNPEPLVPFVDIFILGEGEQVNDELFDLLAEHKRQSRTKNAFLQSAAQIPGVYVPAVAQPQGVKKRIITDLDSCYFPQDFVVPLLEVVHDRTVTEVFRGCIRGCRFCQAGFLNRPVREKSPEVVNAQCRALCDNTGYEEISLCSLSTSDYTRLPELLDTMLDWAVPQKINVSVPSLRIDQFPMDMMKKLALVRRSGLTFAPEAGTQRLRYVINKNITEEQILATARQAFSGGWTAVKLYFMLGLPTETDEDIIGIADLAQKVVDVYYSNPDRPKGKGVQVSVSVATFVPKPFTPFQWEAMDSREEIARKQDLLRASIRSHKIRLHCHGCETSLLEGVFARGDRQLANALELAWRRGARFDSWDDQFNPGLWQECFAVCGIEPSKYLRAREKDEALPWEHLDYGITRQFLWRERERAYAAKTTPNCREACAGCGINEKCEYRMQK